MLELDSEENLVEAAWDRVDLKTRLPKDMRDFFDQLGLVPHFHGSRRAYQRFFVRGKAILSWQGNYFGVYSADASRGGIRFLAPVELELNGRGRIRLPNTKEFQVEIVRCTYLDDDCYDCGAVFVIGS